MAGVKIEGVECQKYEFEYISDELEDRIYELESNIESAKDKKQSTEELDKKLIEAKKEIKILKYEIQKPSFDHIVAGLSQIGTGDAAGLIGTGKVIWELCAISFDKEIEAIPNILISVCSVLAKEYCLPIHIDVKKK